MIKEEQEFDTAKERAEILKRYRALLKTSKSKKKSADSLIIRKAFDMALEAHSGTRRKSGEPYIYHPIEVAQIVVNEIGLSTTSIVCALLHDVVEDTDVTLDDIEGIFGETVARIIDGLTKISQVFDQTSSIQAENFRKMLLTLSDDVRVILIKLADRLHNMRTLGSMAPHKKRKIASETLFLYAPLAHRLGLYAIKSDLEDLGLKYTEPEVYESIETKLKKTKAVRTRFINQFTLPINRTLSTHQLNFDVKGRTKSIYSIWNKMQKKSIPFEEVYDVFAIRIVIDSDINKEKADCWQAYSIVTDFYTPNPDRLRDWISTPKGNGYESLHTTVMSPTGKWVEVQIRTKRMDDIAEKGFAAHWKYKESGASSSLDEWIRKIREMLENPDVDAVDFVDDFKLNLFAKEIFVFTPKGELKTLPVEATTLDFAFDIHTQVGEKCIGAKVNHKLVPLSYQLKSGDQVEIITSRKQKAKEDWLNFVVTGKAKSKIKVLLKEDKRTLAKEGETTLLRKLKSYKIQPTDENIKGIVSFYKQLNQLELNFGIAKGTIDLTKLKKCIQENGQLKFEVPKKPEKTLKQIVTTVRGKADMLVLGENMNDIDYKFSPCCSPIPGDDVFGFITINEGIKIHRVNCPNAMQLMANYAYRIVQAKWTSQESISFLAGLNIKGIDDMGLVNEITKIISSQSKINMQSISFESVDGIFEGKIMLFVQDTKHLNNLTSKLKKISGVHSIERVDTK
ncbi:MAG: bifunctional (p)ppGpp synthetase/guanosine-3',5'-bis(diphosphate) 3'-pyrophosphohydrolase [Flavobacteriales bacterium]|nr:bifunctional (p)ppGpp synthetase/guanosine-3',5'-bis(diphosphate) 3'-pyrophosphohydrolase [Flavobacteriales bacterium]